MSRPVAGRTLTSAPVSTRNWRPESLSQAKRRLSLRPVAETTMGDRPAHFLTKCKGPGTAEQTCDDSSRVCLWGHQEEWVWVWAVGIDGWHWHWLLCPLLPTRRQLSWLIPSDPPFWHLPTGSGYLLAAARGRAVRKAYKGGGLQGEPASHPLGPRVWSRPGAGCGGDRMYVPFC